MSIGNALLVLATCMTVMGFYLHAVWELYGPADNPSNPAVKTIQPTPAYGGVEFGIVRGESLMTADTGVIVIAGDIMEKRLWAHKGEAEWT